MVVLSLLVALAFRRKVLIQRPTRVRAARSARIDAPYPLVAIALGGGRLILGVKGLPHHLHFTETPSEAGSGTGRRRDSAPFTAGGSTWALREEIRSLMYQLVTS